MGTVPFDPRGLNQWGQSPLNHAELAVCMIIRQEGVHYGKDHGSEYQ